LEFTGSSSGSRRQQQSDNPVINIRSFGEPALNTCAPSSRARAPT
jgi:hypothetical protein